MQSVAPKKDQLSIREFPEVVSALGVDLNDLGCVMLDVIPPRELAVIKRQVPEAALAFDPEKFWVRGWVAESSPHITLMYGLLEKPSLRPELVKQVLEGWSIDEVEIEGAGYFESADPYLPLVAHIKVDERLLEGHERLGFLPHINTFTKYKIHMTVAYINKDIGEQAMKKIAFDVNRSLVGKKMEVRPGVLI